MKPTLTAKQVQALIVQHGWDGLTNGRHTWVGLAAYNLTDGWWLHVENTHPQHQNQEFGTVASDRNPAEPRTFKTLEAAIEWARRTGQAVGVDRLDVRVIY